MSDELSLQELRDRMKAAGITMAENRLSMVRKLLSDALVHVRARDRRASKTVAPAASAGRERGDRLHHHSRAQRGLPRAEALAGGGHAGAAGARGEARRRPA